MSDYGRELAEYDWLCLGRWDRLHAPGDVDYQTLIARGWADGTTACGRTGPVSIPGIFTRMSKPRCAHCCRMVGMPKGQGSPKNEDICRPVVEARLRGGSR